MHQVVPHTFQYMNILKMYILWGVNTSYWTTPWHFHQYFRQAYPACHRHWYHRGMAQHKLQRQYVQTDLHHQLLRLATYCCHGSNTPWPFHVFRSANPACHRHWYHREMAQYNHKIQRQYVQTDLHHQLLRLATYCCHCSNTPWPFHPYFWSANLACHRHWYHREMAQHNSNVNMSKRIRIANCFGWPRIVATVQIDLDLPQHISDQHILHAIAIDITEDWHSKISNINMSKRICITNCFGWPRIVATVQIHLDLSIEFPISTSCMPSPLISPSNGAACLPTSMCLNGFASPMLETAHVLLPLFKYTLTFPS